MRSSSVRGCAAALIASDRRLARTGARGRGRSGLRRFFRRPEVSAGAVASGNGVRVIRSGSGRGPNGRRRSFCGWRPDVLHARLGSKLRLVHAPTLVKTHVRGSLTPARGWAFTRLTMQQPAQQSIAGPPPTPPCIDTAYQKPARKQRGQQPSLAGRLAAILGGLVARVVATRAYFAGGRGGVSSSTGVVSSCSTRPSACVMETPIHLRRTSL